MKIRKLNAIDIDDSSVNDDPVLEILSRANVSGVTINFKDGSFISFDKSLDDFGDWER